MGLLSRVKAAALFGCLLFVTKAYSADYVWRASGTTWNSPTALGACKLVLINTLPADFHGWPVSTTGGSRTSSGCQYTRTGESPRSLSPVQRFGDSCPVGTIENMVNGQCEKPVEPPKEPGEKCDDQTGGSSADPMIYDDTVSKCVPFTESKGDAPCTYMAGLGGAGTAMTVAGSLDSGGNAVAPPSFIDKGLSCEVSTVSTSECTINVKGAISCNVIAKLTGKAQGGTTDAADALCEGGTCPAKEPETKTTEEGCTPVGNGTGGSSCTQKKETDQEGTQQCGTVNGAYKCFTKPPYSNGINTAIKSTSETLPDGSVKVTTVKDSSNTVCTDVKKCTTSTSTTTTTTTTKPNGTTTTDTSCKGSCTPNGGGLETNPAAGSGNSGNGTGGGGTGGDGEGEEGGDGTASTTGDCAIAPPCDGDPFQCAILQQAHIDTCKLMAPPTAAELATFDSKIAAEQAAIDGFQATLDSQANTLLSGFQSSTGGSSPGAGKCLPDLPISVKGHAFTMEFSKYCDSLSAIRMAILALAYLFASRVVFREV